jgi:hypothetical protein
MTKGYDFLLPVSGCLGLLVFALLYAGCPSCYFGLLRFWMGEPWSHPFIDFEGVSAAVECWRAGIDVYTTNPCDLLGRVHDYSPIWLRMTFIPAGPHGVEIIGLASALLFLIALGFIPKPTWMVGRASMLAGLFSGMTIYCIERANIDLIVFILIVPAGLALTGGLFRRLGGYAAILAAAMLKFYPAVALAVVCRERLKSALVVATLLAVALVVFFFAYRTEILRAVASVPQGGVFAEAWGARNLPIGLGARLADADHPVVQVRILLVSATVLIWCAFMVVFLTRLTIQHAVAVLPERAYLFLLIGGLLVCGCFFAGANAGYRGIFLLFVLPACLFIGRSSPLFRWTAWAILLVMWAIPLRRALAVVVGGSAFPVHGSVFLYGAWFVNELAWWWIVSVLLGVLVRFVLDSPATRALFGREIVAPSGAA